MIKSVLKLIAAFGMAILLLLPVGVYADFQYSEVDVDIPVYAVGSYGLKEEGASDTELVAELEATASADDKITLSFDEPGTYVYELFNLDASDVLNTDRYKVTVFVTTGGADSGGTERLSASVVIARGVEKTDEIRNYAITLKKVDANYPDVTLAGAEFDLYASDAVNDQGELIEPEGDEAAPQPLKHVVTDEDGRVFLGDMQAGVYYLVETKAPSGYNRRVGPLKLVISHEVQTVDGVDIVNDVIALNGRAAELTQVTEVNGEVREYTVTAENSRGTLMPEMGGRGTWMFYALGGAIVAAAALLLLREDKRRMG